MNYNTHNHTHIYITHTYIYIYIYVYLCACVLEEFSMYTVYATSFSPLSVFESENHAAGVFLIAIGGVITSTRPGVVELRQQVFKPASHYRTEQRDRFDDPGPQPRNDTLVPSVTVHLGDDRPGYSPAIPCGASEDSQRGAGWRQGPESCREWDPDPHRSVSQAGAV